MLEVGRSSLVIGSVATLLYTNILLLEQRACWLRGGEDRFDDEGVQLIVGLVVVVGAPSFGCVVHPESELDFVRHCLLLAKWDDHSPALAAIAGEGLHKAEVAAVGEAEPVQLGYRVQLSFMRPVLGCWDSFDERQKGDVLVGGICLGPAGSPTSR